MFHGSLMNQERLPAVGIIHPHSSKFLTNMKNMKVSSSYLFSSFFADNSSIIHITLVTKDHLFDIFICMLKESID